MMTNDAVMKQLFCYFGAGREGERERGRDDRLLINFRLLHLLSYPFRDWLACMDLALARIFLGLVRDGCEETRGKNEGRDKVCV